ncbi:MAG: acetate/propionate family kinase [Nevskiaceae bacterium]|nr:MAG: acetate/propionate family kinase [Nevskiaceae bacterium]TBR72819.1 MAG: acetate/propionate family kinase [Nevskiaceae bacterium]
MPNAAPVHSTLPTAAAGAILVLNCGSSSIKFALFDAGANPLPRTPFWNGKVQGIGVEKPDFGATGIAPRPITLGAAHPYRDALAYIRRQVMQHLGSRPLAAAVHRVVHGGSRYFAPVRMTPERLADLRQLVPLAPLHQPFALEAVQELAALDPSLPQFACFDTGFHRTMPEVEQMMALPWSAWESGIRRYGFHGLSYEYMTHALPERYGALARGRVIVAHLGNGASLCALHDLKSVSTTMGFSALDGLVMGTRCGNLDPGALIYLMQIRKLSLDAVIHMLNHESGLLGLSGVSADLRTLLPLEANHPRVQAALALYVRRIVREIGALVAVLGGLDLLVFTAGVGEHSSVIRARTCAQLAWLGVALDAAANACHAPTVSTPDSRVTVGVEPTNEEWVAAWHAQKMLAGEP